jgi:hypothetical protein
MILRRSELNRDILDFHIKLAKTLQSESDQITNLIGNAHHPTSGMSKEEKLRAIFKEKLPGKYSVNEGFVIFDSNHQNLKTSNINSNQFKDRLQSHQIDVLICNEISKPRVKRENNLVFVTKDAVAAIIGVKTGVNDTTSLLEDFNKIADDVSQIRDNRPISSCYAGVFIFEDRGLSDQLILETIQKASNSNIFRVINFVSVGPDRFFRFWLNGKQDAGGFINGPTWHSYNLKLPEIGISHSYFISNIVWELSDYHSSEEGFIWFPLENGKESRRKCAIDLTGDNLINFGEESSAKFIDDQSSPEIKYDESLINAAICRLEDELEVKLERSVKIGGATFEAGYACESGSIVVLVRYIEKDKSNYDEFSSYLSTFIWRNPAHLTFLRNNIIYFIAISNDIKLERLMIKNKLKKELDPSLNLNIETECYSVEELKMKYG